MRRWTPHLLLLLTAAGLLAGEGFLKRRSERTWQRMENDRERFFTTLDGRHAATADRLTLGMGELQRLMPEMKEQIRALGADLKRVEQIRQTAMHTETTFVTRLRDSVTIRADTLRVFEFANDYLQVAGRARGDSQWVRLGNPDARIRYSTEIEVKRKK